ncbi:HAD family phosphatase [Streptomyces sp. NPDC001904]|uniref:HAD family hydrolase n=1 Tax=Streptomyces sp. NPDC001904 TaxID=3154531 RepID=UPI0033290B1B
MSAPATSVIWFDFGGVLSPPLEELYDAYETKTGITPEQLQGAMKEVAAELDLPTLAPVELGTMSEPEWGAALARVLEDRHPGIDLGRARLTSFGEQWFSGIEANQSMICAFRYAQANGFRAGVLSNNVLEWEPHWMRIIAPLGPVDLLIDSCKVGVRKPDPKIFELAADRAGVRAEECLLIDDLEENCAAAAATGWRTVHFRNNHQALTDLQRLTGLPSIY